MSSNDYRSALDTPDAPRAGCYALPSWALALHFRRAGQEVTGPKASATPSAAAQAKARATDAAGGLVTVTHPCAWCRRNYSRVIEREFVGAVLNGGVCDECYDADERARGHEE